MSLHFQGIQKKYLPSSQRKKKRKNLIDKHQANEYIEDESSHFFWINLSFFPSVWIRLGCELSGEMCFLLKLWSVNKILA